MINILFEAIIRLLLFILIVTEIVYIAFIIITDNK